MPNRIIKESICRSDSIDSLSMFAEICFYRLIVNADDYGRFDGRLPILKAAMFPLKDISTDEIKHAMIELINAGLVECYMAGGKPYIRLTGWDDHQQVRATKSKFPAPDIIYNHMISDDINENKCLISDDINGNQMISDDSKCPRNPIRNPIRNPNPIREAGVESESRRSPKPAAAVADGIDLGTVEVYLANNITGLSATLMQEFQTFKDDLPEELIRYAIDEACAQNVRSYSYLRKILNRYVDKGFKTIGDVKADRDAFERGKKAKAAPAKHNYQQHEYTEGDFGADFYYDPSKDYGGGV